MVIKNIGKFKTDCTIDFSFDFECRTILTFTRFAALIIDVTHLCNKIMIPYETRFHIWIPVILLFSCYIYSTMYIYKCIYIY